MLCKQFKNDVTQKVDGVTKFVPEHHKAEKRGDKFLHLGMAPYIVIVLLLKSGTAISVSAAVAPTEHAGNAYKSVKHYEK